MCGSQFYAETSPRSWRGYSSIACVLPIYPYEGDKIKLYYCSEAEATMNPTPWKPVLWDRTQDLDGEIPLHDDQKLDEVTALRYNKTSGQMTISTKDGVEWELKGDGGAAAADAVKYVGTELYIDTSLLPKGSYTLKLHRSKDSLELKLKMGLK